MCGQLAQGVEWGPEGRCVGTVISLGCVTRSASMMNEIFWFLSWLSSPFPLCCSSVLHQFLQDYPPDRVRSDPIIGRVITVGIQSLDDPRCVVSYSLDRLVIFSERGWLITERRSGVNRTIG